MRKLIYRDEVFYYDAKKAPSGISEWRDTTVIRVFEKRLGFYALFKPFKELRREIVRGGETPVAALTRLLDEMHGLKTEAERPLMIKCSKEIEELYGP